MNKEEIKKLDQEKIVGTYSRYEYWWQTMARVPSAFL